MGVDERGHARSKGPDLIKARKVRMLVNVNIWGLIYLKRTPTRAPLKIGELLEDIV